MKPNVGGIDRILRIVVGLAIVASALVLPEGYRGWAAVGLIPLATGLIGWCPAYLPFGLSSCRVGRR